MSLGSVLHTEIILLNLYDYNMHVEGLLPANLCLVTFLSSEQGSQFERFYLQHA